jgi:hypothetical protein
MYRCALRSTHSFNLVNNQRLGRTLGLDVTGGGQVELPRFLRGRGEFWAILAAGGCLVLNGYVQEYAHLV